MENEYRSRRKNRASTAHCGRMDGQSLQINDPYLSNKQHKKILIKEVLQQFTHPGFSGE
jgi:hypothetical protein